MDTSFCARFIWPKERNFTGRDSYTRRAYLRVIRSMVTLPCSLARGGKTNSLASTYRYLFHFSFSYQLDYMFLGLGGEKRDPVGILSQPIKSPRFSTGNRIDTVLLGECRAVRGEHELHV